jgi:hypothetical protein
VTHLTNEQKFALIPDNLLEPKGGCRSRQAKIVNKFNEVKIKLSGETKYIGSLSADQFSILQSFGSDCQVRNTEGVSGSLPATLTNRYVSNN